MSLWADQQIKELRAEVTQLRKELDELKAPRGTSDSLMVGYQIKIDKAKKPRREADDLI